MCVFTVVQFLFRISSSLLTLFSKIHTIFLKIIPTWPIKLQVDILISKNQVLQILYVRTLYIICIKLYNYHGFLSMAIIKLYIVNGITNGHGLGIDMCRGKEPNES